MGLRISLRLVLIALLSPGLAASSGARHEGSEAWRILRSSLVAIAPSGRSLAVINPDSNSISLVDIPSRSLIAEIPVGCNPQTLSFDPSASRLFVSNRGDDSLSVVDLEAAQAITSIPVEDEPFGVVASQDGRVYVANQGSHSIQIVDPDAGEAAARLGVEAGPRSLALSPSGERLFATHFQSGRLSIIDTRTFTVEKVISTGPDSNLSQGLLIDPLENLAYLPQTRSNATNQALLFDTTVFPIVSLVDLTAMEHLPAKRIFLDLADRPVNLPLDAALTSSGKLYVVNAGSDDLSVIDVASNRGLAHIEAGRNPRGAALSPDERRLYVVNSLSGTVSVVDTFEDQVVDQIPVTQIPLPEGILNGKILFNTSSRTDLSRDQWISCASCHFDGKTDGRSWFFADGPRNTPSLIGVKDTLPLHWSGDLDELQDVESTIRNIQAGTGLADGTALCDPACDQAPANAGRSRDLDDLAAYMASLTFGPNPNLDPDGALTEPSRRGQAIFLSRQAGCASCHPPPLYTDRQRHDVGTATSPLEAKGGLFDTPSLRGAYQTAPYLHDGSAATLLEVVTTRNREDRHGVTSHLSPESLGDLMHFLQALPYQPPLQGLAQFGHGEGISSTLILVNPSSSQTASGTVDLFDAQGNGLEMSIDGQVRQGRFSFEVPVGGAAFLDTDGAAGLVAGSARIRSNFLLGGGALISGRLGSAGAEALRPLSDFLAVIQSDASNDLRTGLALANPSSGEAAVQMTLRRADGTPLPNGSVSLSLAANARLAEFPEQIFAGQGIDFSDFLGSLEVKSSQPILAMAVRVSPGGWAAVPMTGLDIKARPLHFAHFADGQGIASALILVNPSGTRPVSGTALFFDENGEELAVDINGQRQSGILEFELPPKGTGFYSTDGAGELASGSVRLTSSLPIGAILLFKGRHGTAAAASLEPMRRFLIPIESNATLQIQTGVAVANPASRPIEFSLTLRQDSGAALASASVTLPGHAQLAGFPEQIFASSGVDFSSFRGTLEVSSTLPAVGLALRIRPAELAALPVTRMN